METEESLQAKLDEAKDNLKEAKRTLDSARRQLIDAETNFIQQKLNSARLAEQLRRFQAAHPKPEITGRELEIERFRKAYPEVCAQAAQRDRDRE